MRLVTSLVLLALVGLLAACGGSGQHPATSTGGSSGGSIDAAAAKAQVTSVYQRFFSSKTPLPDRVGLLQNGQKFQSLFKSFASNPLAKNTSATVSSVTLQGANKARVVYTLKVGAAALPKSTGDAVRENGHWKVGDATLCKLVVLGGSTPSPCKTP